MVRECAPRRRGKLAWVLGGLLAFMATAEVEASASAPEAAYHGLLLDGRGSPVQGEVDFELAIWSDLRSVEPDDRVHRATFPRVQLEEGRFTLPLADALPPSPGSRDCWVELTAGGEVLGPRTPCGEVVWGASRLEGATGPSGAAASPPPADDARKTDPLGHTRARLSTGSTFTLASPVLAAAEAGATFLVDARTDAGDADPGDGVCASAGGACTLRAAIDETNALPGEDVVEIPPAPTRSSSPARTRT